MQQDMARLEEQLAELEDEREQLTRLIAASHEAQLATAQRQEAALALARAEGTASALEPRGGPVGPDQATISELSSDLRVLEAAKGQCADWVRDDQKQWLIDLGEDITALAREFGIANLTDVALVGNATMKVHQGGQSSSYSACERGEKLRLKLATAIALIKQGRTSGVGRHPGLLFVDSPGSEEVQQDDLDTMLEALQREATAADIQVLIGTRHTDELLRLLGEERCRLGLGTNYVW
jgi:hypothetical protein